MHLMFVFEIQLPNQEKKKKGKKLKAKHPKLYSSGLYNSDILSLRFTPYLSQVLIHFCI